MCARSKTRRKFDPEKQKARDRELYLKNREHILPKKCSQMNKSYYKDKEKFIKRASDYQAKRMKTDPAYRAIRNARDRVRKFIRGKIGYSKSLGCSFQNFKNHIELQFQPEMTWENYGKWEIDHIYPLSVAVTNKEEFKIACHYSNLQPLWKIDNIRKGNHWKQSLDRNSTEDVNL